MKRKMLTILAGVVFLHVILLAGVCISGGCSSNKVLANRTYQPAQPLAPILPPSDLSKAPEAVEEIPALPETKVESLKHTVVKGDSLWKIANEYGVSIGELAAYNKIPAKKVLRVGEVINIPPGGHAGAKASKAAAEKSFAPKAGAAAHKEVKKVAGEALPADGTYTVKEGDSLWKIAVKYNLKTETLASANNVDPKKGLKVGQKLVIPKGGAAVASKAPVAKETKTDAKSATAAPAAAEETGLATEGPIDLPPTSSSGTEDILNDIAKMDSAATPKASAAPAVAAPKAAAPAASLPAAAPVAAAPAASGDVIEIDEDTTVDIIASQYGVKAAEIKKLNPNIPADGKLKAGSKVSLPQ